MSACSQSSINTLTAIEAIDAVYLRTPQQHAHQNGLAAPGLEFLTRLIASTAWPRWARRGVISSLPQHRTRARAIDCDVHGSAKGSFTSSRQGYGEAAAEVSVSKAVIPLPASTSSHLLRP